MNRRNAVIVTLPTAYEVQSIAALGDHKIAGRIAAASVLIGAAMRTGGSADNLKYDGKHGLNVIDMDIGPAIDAAVEETIVRISCPDKPAVIAAKKRWWQFWDRA